MNFAASFLKQGTQLSSMSCFLHAGNPRAATFATAQQPGLLRSTAPDIAALQLHASVLSPVAVLHVAPVFVRAVPASTTSSSTCSVDNAQNCRICSIPVVYLVTLALHGGAYVKHRSINSLEKQSILGRSYRQTPSISKAST
jgi:hypothetical protein